MMMMRTGWVLFIREGYIHGKLFVSVADLYDFILCFYYWR